MQQSSSNAIGDLHVDGTEIDLVVDFTGVGANEVFSDSESENGEFNEHSDEIASLFHPYLRRSPLRSPSLSPSVRRRSPPPFAVALPLRSPSLSPSVLRRSCGPFIPSSSRSLHSIELAVPSFRSLSLSLCRKSQPKDIASCPASSEWLIIGSYADFLAGSFPSSPSAGLGSPATQGTSVPQPQPASIIEDRLLNELLVAPGREFLPKLSPNGEPNTSW
ncbi:hypothetical protein F2Q69_00015916 [Brassica cretica]|uniref:Uncharacterized protein n=1 Tax=Brassica cretica TaxID=69181 RepID=A0A8S9QJT1_BRACR|nr:hypothetical protein F2Q69_00015916 [Brassica cretica]